MGIGSAVGKIFGRDVSGEAAQIAAKEAAREEAGVAATEASKTAAKTASGEAASEAAKTAAKDAAEQEAKKASKLTAKDVAKYAGLAAAAGVGVYLYAQSDQKANASNNTPRQITKVESGGGLISSSLKITFTPALKILKSDSITFEGTQCKPSIDGPQSVASVIGPSQITIGVSKMPTDLNPGGVIHVKTTAAAQAADTVGETAANVGSGAGNVFGDFLGGMFGNLGGLASTLGGLCACLCFLACCAFIIMSVMKG